MRRLCIVVTLVCMIGTGTGCAKNDTSELIVELKTDLQPPQEFATVVTQIEAFGTPQTLERVDDVDFVQGGRVAEYLEVPNGPQQLSVNLQAADGQTVLQRRVTVEVDGPRVVTVVATRDCRGVMCPIPGGNPVLLACVGGACADPRCTPETPEHCPQPECIGNEDCPGDGFFARCIAGTCFDIQLPRTPPPPPPPPQTGLRITDHSDGGMVRRFEERFRGMCNHEHPLTIAPGPKVTVISSTCTPSGLDFVLGFTHTSSRAERRTFRLDNGPESLDFGVRFRFDCPPNFVGVPGNEAYRFSGRDFCVAKYEMKALDPSGMLAFAGNGDQPYAIELRPASRADGTAWMGMTVEQAQEECDSLGFGYDLISNDQWQVVARNIERTAVNWHSTGDGPDGVVGVGMIARGHCDGSMNPFGATDFNSALPASPDDSDGYRGTGQTATDPWQIDGNQSGGEQLRTHVLSNGEVIWDFSGSAWEWVEDEVDVGDLNPSLQDEIWYSFTNLNIFGLESENRMLFGPAGNYGAAQGMGRAYGGNGIAVARGHYGGGAGRSENAGIFAAGLNGAQIARKGFRCIFR